MFIKDTFENKYLNDMSSLVINYVKDFVELL